MSEYTETLAPIPGQLSLMENVRPSDPPTSHLAAQQDRTALKAQVRERLKASPDGLTDWELTTMLGLPLERKPTVGKRRQECGAVDSRVKRPSPLGLPCIVWRLP